MPVILSTLIVVIAALSGWFLSYLFIRLVFRPYSPKEIIGFRLHGIFPAILPGLAVQLSDIARDRILNEKKIAAMLNNAALLQQLKPTIETHVDEFLKVKLKEAFPLLSNFMGEKTLAKFKEAFLIEVETILPELLTKYSGILLHQLQPEKLIEDLIKNMNVAEMEKMIKQKAARQFMLFQLGGLLLGAVTGVLQLLLIWLF